MQLPATVPPPPPPTALPPLRPAASLFRPWYGDDVDGAEGEGAGTPPPPPPTPLEPAAAPWSRPAVVVVWPCHSGVPSPNQRRGLASTTCALAPLEGLCPRSLRLRDVLAGAWNGWWHTHH